MRVIPACFINTFFSSLIKTDRYFETDKYRFIFVLLLSLLFSENYIFSQADSPGYDEISVLLQVEKVGSFYTEALYSPDNELFISVEELFKYLRIPCIVEQKGDSLGGFIAHEDHPYSIKYRTKEISFNNKIIEINSGLVRQTGILFMNTNLFGEVFGIRLTFNFRSLSLSVKSDFELPAVKEIRLEKMRNNISRNNNIVLPDTVLGRSYHNFRAGIVDWSLMSNEIIDHKTDTRVGLGFGAELLRGEADILLNYSTIYKFDNRQQQYLWKWVDNDNLFLRQVHAGKIAAQTISSLYYPVIGSVITNTPASVRKAAGEYIISDVTEPDWTVELYINNVLMDFTQADASGFFMFRVPLVYGFVSINLRFYGPMGEERSEMRTMNMPYSFIPSGEVEYRISGGFLEDGESTPFGRGEVNWGLNRSITVGGGLEYLASITTGKSIPFVTFSVLPLSKLMIKADYAHGVRSRLMANYYLWASSTLEIDYTRYVKGQRAILYNYLEERKVNFSIPVNISNLSGYARIGYKQNVYPNFKYNMAELLLSAYYRKVSSNISTYLNWVNENSVYTNTMAAFSYRMRNGFTVRPSVQFNLTKGELISFKAEVEKRFAKSGHLSVSYENIRISDYHGLNLSFRYDLNFAQTDATVRISNKEIAASQGARGSLSFGSRNKKVIASERLSVGRGGISLIPFIDVNHNGKFDKEEKMVENLSVKINGGKVVYGKKDPIILVTGLDPFINYNIELSDKDFENIAWRLKKKTYKVLIDPNQFKTIEIPIVPAGEISGIVYIKRDSLIVGLGRILVNIYNSSGARVVQTLSESDGYFSHLGLDPGGYTARIDSQQLSWLNYFPEPYSIPFFVKATEEGDIIDGLEFTLSSTITDNISEQQVVPEKPAVKKDTTIIVVHEVTQELVTVSEDSYAIQLGAFRQMSNAEVLKNKLQSQLGRKVGIIIEDDFYKVRIDEIKERIDVDDIITTLQKNGITELWLISLKAKKQQMMLVEKQETIIQINETAQDISYNQGIIVQVGAFRDRSNAIALLKQLSVKYGSRVKMVFEDDFYKLRLSGMSPVKKSVMDEMNKLGPSIGKIKFNDIWMMAPFSSVSEDLLPEPEREVITIEKSERKLNMPEFMVPETTTIISAGKNIKQVMQPSLTVSIQVGIFIKKSDALKAQRKISSKLSLNVEVVERWEQYIVLIRGFHTREETYKYYPELAGLGYPGVSLIEE